MKKILDYLTPIILAIIFIIFTILVKTVDVHYIYKVGYLGFYTANMNVFNHVLEFGRTGVLDKVTDVGLYLSIAIVLAFAVVGLVQLIKRKSFKKVDPIIYVLLATYVISVAFYLIFEIAKINYSPFSTPDELKASYPSSHILAFSVFLTTGVIALFHYFKANKILIIVTYILTGLLCLVFALSRLYSGEHYLSDVIGSLLLSGIIISLFVSLKREFVKPVELVEEEK